MEFFLWLWLYSGVAGMLAAVCYFVRRLFIRRALQARQPAPKLNPRWDTSVCHHSKLEPVIASGETEVIAYLCTDPECYAQLELADQAVLDHLKQERILKGWEHVGNSLEQAQAFAARTQAIEGGPYVQVQLDTARFARETRAAIDRELTRKKRQATKYGGKNKEFWL